MTQLATFALFLIFLAFLFGGVYLLGRLCMMASREWPQSDEVWGLRQHRLTDAEFARLYPALADRVRRYRVPGP